MLITSVVIVIVIAIFVVAGLAYQLDQSKKELTLHQKQIKHLEEINTSDMRITFDLRKKITKLECENHSKEEFVRRLQGEGLNHQRIVRQLVTNQFEVLSLNMHDHIKLLSSCITSEDSWYFDVNEIRPFIRAYLIIKSDIQTHNFDEEFFKEITEHVVDVMNEFVNDGTIFTIDPNDECVEDRLITYKDVSYSSRELALITLDLLAKSTL